MRYFLGSARLLHLKRCWDDTFEVASNGRGLHPKMARQLNLIWKPLEKVGGDIGRARRRRTKQKTWKDSNENTLFAD
jgi:hypothetical protein